MTPTSIVAYLVLFAGGAFLFLLVSLLLGRLLRAQVPTPEKLRSYECGEPAVGTSEVQFDLRFYVVALVFLIFDVEVAFFFPWAVVFGKANQVAQVSAAAANAQGAAADSLQTGFREKYRELGANDAPDDQDPVAAHNTARRLAFFSLVDLGAFFLVLLVGFAYVWNQGDLDWVRALGRDRGETAERPLGGLEIVPR
jgi:NADH-quinone oxidoreductase subunit A